MKPVLSIHEITTEILAIPKDILAEYTLTFDDGLYSQYINWGHFKSIPTEKIFFITSSIVHPKEGSSQISNISSKIAHKKFFEKGLTNSYMTLKQISRLKNEPNVIIGGHSYSHFKEKVLLLNLPKKGYLEAKFNFIRKDTEKMVDWFNKTLNQEVTHFCYPYNNTYNKLYTSIVKNIFKIENVYGEERTLIEDLL
jgi:hypothetical protein